MYSILGPGGSFPSNILKAFSFPKTTITRAAASNRSFLVSIAERTTFDIFHSQERMESFLLFLFDVLEEGGTAAQALGLDDSLFRPLNIE